MIKCEVIEDFRLGDFKKLKNIVRKGKSLEGYLYKGDTFECDEEMAEYLTGHNKLNKSFVKVIELIPNNEKLITESEIKYTEEEVKPKVTIKRETKTKKKKSSKK